MIASVPHPADARGQTPPSLKRLAERTLNRLLSRESRSKAASHQSHFNQERPTMKMSNFRMSTYMCGALCSFVMFILVIGATRPAAAQWTVSNTSHAWSSYNGSYLYLESDGFSKVFTTTEG